ncbi:ABC transporter substrate-binding protein [Cumulibacter soli]|uniref:ABC transporter substrate-binding protein n=1 Tax=Cumulibacter soli TaxID=2546344 RepID=UPI001067AEFD|nr:ABC transporter substrate-binding protein [Cumulibacter soli]
MKRRSTKLSVGLAVLALLLAGCGDGSRDAKDPAAEAEAYTTDIPLADDIDPNGHIRTGEQAIPPTWDPTESITNGDATAYVAVYDRLLRTGEDGTAQPMLAESYESADDDAAMILHLREDATFSDGEPFNAEAVKFNLDRARAKESTIAGDLSMIKSVEVVDEYTVKVNVTTGIGALAISLTSRAGMMVSPKAAKAGGLPEMPVGIGPFVATNINPGVSIELEKNPDYWDPDVQKVAKMTYTLYSDDQARYNALISGEIDVARINPDQLEEVEANGAIGMVHETPLYLYLAVNASQPPFDDPEMRKALNMAIDREGIAQGLYDGFCTPSIQNVPESSPGYSDKIGDGSDIFPYDPEAAKKIIEEHGATGYKFTAVPPNVTIYTKFAEIVQQQLKDVGLDMTVKPVPAAQLVQEYGIDATAEATASIATVLNDPYQVHSRYLSPDALLNGGKTDYPELNAAADAAAKPLDPAERKPLYEKYWDIWVENPPHIVPVCMVHLAGAVNPNISGVKMLPDGGIDLRGAGIAKE